MERSLQDMTRALQTKSNVLWNVKFTCQFPTIPQHPNNGGILLEIQRNGQKMPQKLYGRLWTGHTSQRHQHSHQNDPLPIRPPCKTQTSSQTLQIHFYAITNGLPRRQDIKRWRHSRSSQNHWTGRIPLQYNQPTASKRLPRGCGLPPHVCQKLFNNRSTYHMLNGQRCPL